MCAIYELISKDRVHLPDFFGPNFNYEADANWVMK